MFLRESEVYDERGETRAPCCAVLPLGNRKGGKSDSKRNLEIPDVVKMGPVSKAVVYALQYWQPRLRTPSAQLASKREIQYNDEKRS